jgi:hypothetical protein
MALNLVHSGNYSGDLRRRMGAESVRCGDVYNCLSPEHVEGRESIVISFGRRAIA